MGVRVTDIAAQQQVDVEGKEAQEGFLAGKYQLPKGEPLYWKGLDGGIYKIDAADAVSAIQDGHSLLSPEEAASLRMQREESDLGSTLQGAAESVAAGATLGLSSMALEALGGDEYVDRMRARDQALGGVGDVLEGVGGLAGLIGTGGAGVAAKVGVAAGKGFGAKAVAKAAASTLTAPARGVMAAGQAVERGLAGAVGKGATSLGGRALQRAVPLAGRGAVEGAAFGVGNEIHESVLGEREITAERLAGAGLMGSLLGAGGEVALGGLGAMALGSKNIAVSSAKKVLGRVAHGSGESSEAMAKALAKRYSQATGAPAEPLEHIATLMAGGKEQRAMLNKALYNTSEVVDDTARTVQTSLQSVKDTLAAARMATQGVNKLKRIEQLVPKNADIIAPRMAAKTLEDVTAKLRGMQELNAQRGFASYLSNDLDDAIAAATRAEAEMLENATAAGSHRSLDRLKQSLDHITSSRSGLMANASPQVADTVKGLREATRQIRDHLEDTVVWGRAGELQREMNAAVSGHLQAVQKSEGYIKRLFDPQREVSGQEALTLARQFGKFAGESKHEKLDDILEAQLNALRTAEKHYELAPDVVAKIRAAEQEVNKMRSALKTKAEVAAVADEWQKLRSFEGMGSPSITTMSTLGPSIGSTLGFAAGGPVGMALGALAGSVTRPYTALRSLAGIMQMVDKMEIRTGSAVGRFLSGAGKGAKAAGRVVRRAATVAAGQAAGRKETRHEKMERVKLAVAELSTSPAKLEEGLRNNLEFVRAVAPGVSSAIENATVRGTQFLMAKLPPVYKPPMSTQPPMVDHVSLSKFLRYTEVVEDPVVALERLADRSLTVEHAEALRVVYPAIFADVQSKIVDELSEKEARGERVPFRDRVQLGILFDVPADQSLTPESQALIQSAHIPGQDVHAQPMPKARAGAGPQITKPSRMASGMDRLQGGMDA